VVDNGSGMSAIPMRVLSFDGMQTSKNLKIAGMTYFA